VVSFDKTIFPGGEGKIKIYIDTSNYEGVLKKSVFVDTNDSDMPQFVLTVKANVISPIYISPKKVYLIGGRKDILKANVNIKANLDKPLKIIPISFDLKDKIRYYIDEMQNKREYRIRFIKFPSDDNKLTGRLRIKTNYSEMPYIDIYIKGYFR